MATMQPTTPNPMQALCWVEPAMMFASGKKEVRVVYISSHSV
jgi:hypothetical protein